MLIKLNLIALLICITFSTADAERPNCHYSDSVDLKGSQKFPNGSYLYENIIIPAELTGEYDYEVDPNGETEKKHMRGCVCKGRACIPFCCPPHQHLLAGKCYNHTEQDVRYDSYLNVTLNNGTEVRAHVKEMFVVQLHVPLQCKKFGHSLLDSRKEEDAWMLFENGTLKLVYDNAYFDKTGYCWDQRLHHLAPHRCFDPPSKPWARTIVIGLTLFCLMLTLAVYLFVPKLRTLNAKCFFCYLISIFVGFSLYLLNLWNLSEPFCHSAGYLGYYACIAAFFWLTAMSFELWRRFKDSIHNVHLKASKNRFLTYSFFVWGMAFIMTMLVILLDHTIPHTFENVFWLPGVGYYSEGSCWIKTHDWSAMLYIYGPILILITFNITLFILITKHVLAAKKQVKQPNMGGQDKPRKHVTNWASYKSFLRLSVLMGISWIFQIGSYLVQGNTVLENIFLISDYFHLGQGIVIFVLFVLRRDVLTLCSERFRG